jgi:hypothetical protein
VRRNAAWFAAGVVVGILWTAASVAGILEEELFGMVRAPRAPRLGEPAAN